MRMFARSQYLPTATTAEKPAVIAESAMYVSIYHDSIDGLKFLGGVWGGVELSDNLVNGLAKAGGTALAATGEGSSINITDSLNSAVFGAPAGGSTISNLFNRSTDNSVASFLPAEAQ